MLDAQDAYEAIGAPIHNRGKTLCISRRTVAADQAAGKDATFRTNPRVTLPAMPTASRTAYDAANPYAPIPPGAAIVAGYVDGKYRTYAPLHARFPNAFDVPITVLGDVTAMVADRETGDMTPAQAAAWAKIKVEQRIEPATIYCNLSDHADVTAALEAEGLSWANPAAWPGVGVYWWAAGYRSQPYLAPGSVATQWSGGITAPYDISDTNGLWPYLTPPAPTPAGGAGIIGIARTPTGKGYWLATAAGQVAARGDAAKLGDLSGHAINKPIVGIFANPAAPGYWLIASDGGVFNFSAPLYGSLGSTHLNAPIVAGMATPTGKGYWLVGADGGVFQFGDAKFRGSTASLKLNQPIVAAVCDPKTAGYVLIARDGGTFPFSAPFAGSLGAVRLNAPIVSAAEGPDGNGYWLTASDGGVFPLGEPFYGSAGNVHLNQPVVGMTASPTGHGYALTAADGGVFNFGDFPFEGAAA